MSLKKLKSTLANLEKFNLTDLTKFDSEYDDIVMPNEIPLKSGTTVKSLADTPSKTTQEPKRFMMDKTKTLSVTNTIQPTPKKTTIEPDSIGKTPEKTTPEIGLFGATGEKPTWEPDVFFPTPEKPTQNPNSFGDTPEKPVSDANPVILFTLISPLTTRG